MDRRLNGLNTSSYLGVNASTPPDLVVFGRAPTQRDYISFVVGTFWLDISANPITSANLWFLTSTANFQGTWRNFAGGAGSLVSLTGDMGPVVTPDVNGNIDVFGGVLIQTTGGVSQLTVGLAPGDDGQIPIAGTGLDTIYANLISPDGSVTINNLPNAIELTTTTGTLATLTTDAGVVTPAAGNVDVLGGELINTAGAGDTLTINLDRGLDGQVPIAATGAPTIYANLTSNDASITITNTPNGIDLANNGAGGSSITITIFDVSGMWTKGVGTRFVEVYGWSGGGGGGSGQKGNTQGGGAGGAWGTVAWYRFPGAFVGATSNIVIGAGGLGGASQTVVAAGNQGGSSGQSSFGNLKFIERNGGSGSQSGGRGGSGTQSGGFPQYYLQTIPPFTGPGGSISNDAIRAGSGTTSTGGNSTGAGIPTGLSDTNYKSNYLEGTGGGGGGGGAAANSGGKGGDVNALDGTIVNAGGIAGVGAGGNAGNGNAAVTDAVADGIMCGGTGGGGGASGASTTNGGTGGNGGFPGGGGGGGGGSLSIFNSGAGGNGAAGRIVVIEYA